MLTVKRGFMPDSGILTHLNLPETNEDVRIDAGFIAGDTVSSHYDPMIAKLIVRAEDRTSAIQKLHAALEQYEIAGMATNIEFIKKVCQTPAFIAGDVETGFIKKHDAELFVDEPIPFEIYAQAAIYTLSQSHKDYNNNNNSVSGPIGFIPTSQARQFHFQVPPSSSTAASQSVTVDLTQDSSTTYTATINSQTYPAIRSTYHASTRTLTSFFSHTRLDTRIIPANSTPNQNLTIFSRGNQHMLTLTPPPWLSKALGTTELQHSVLAPMPCKILRVDVKLGDSVVKGQPLVVVESMKMETVIRSPQDGVVRRVGGKKGVSSPPFYLMEMIG